jgi:radical SAM protein with 4Fe4S-binding SPASM domain
MTKAKAIHSPKSPYVRTASLAAWTGPAVSTGRPARLDIELTERCNFHCLHCTINRPEDDDAAMAAEMRTSQVIEVLRQAAGLGILSVRFTGGEPMLRDDFEEIYRTARGLGLRVSLFTNASLITIRKAELLGTVPPLEPVEVSIYGMSDSSTSRATGVPGARRSVARGLKLLEMFGVRFATKFVVLPANADEVEAYRRWMRDRAHGAGKPAFLLPTDLRARRDNVAASAAIAALRLAPDKAAAFHDADGEDYRREMMGFCRAQCRPQGAGLFGCGAGTETACIDANGRFQLCLRLRHPDTTTALGAGGLAEALKTFAPKVRRQQARAARYLERCALCFLKALCEQCPASSWVEHGTLDTPVEYHCRIAHAQAVRLGILKKGEKAWTVQDWRQRLDRPAAGGSDARQARS